MNEPKDPEAAETVQTTSDQAVDPAAICSALPCPFCGESAKLKREAPTHNKLVFEFLVCSSCGAQGPVTLCRENSSRVYDRWNTRINQAQAPRFAGDTLHVACGPNGVMFTSSEPIPPEEMAKLEEEVLSSRFRIIEPNDKILPTREGVGATETKDDE